MLRSFGIDLHHMRHHRRIRPRRKQISLILLKSRQRIQENWRLLLLLIPFFIVSRGRISPHPTSIPADHNTLAIPRNGEPLLHYVQTYAVQKNLPVYMFYKARSGQLNNQLISFFNALTLAKRANATLVAPFAFGGSESYIDFSSKRGFLFHMLDLLDENVYHRLLKFVGLFYAYDELVGDYIDAGLLNTSQPVISIRQFLQSRGADYLRSFPHVLARRGDAGFYYMSLGKRALSQANVNIRGEVTGHDKRADEERIASRKELDCNFNVSDYFRGLQFYAGVNGNFLFLPKLYRSHSLNCTFQDPYWLHVRRFVQPNASIRELVSSALQNWGKVLSVHLRLFPFDVDKFDVDAFCNSFRRRFKGHLDAVDHLYIAYSVSSEPSRQIIASLREMFGTSKVLTAQDFGDLQLRGSDFNKHYSLPLVDMWTCVRSSFFVGRLGSSLSWNVAYWREAFQDESTQGHEFYSLHDFSRDGVQNPTDSYKF